MNQVQSGNNASSAYTHTRYTGYGVYKGTLWGIILKFLKLFCTLLCNETCECIHGMTTSSVYAGNVESKIHFFLFNKQLNIIQNVVNICMSSGVGA